MKELPGGNRLRETVDLPTSDRIREAHRSLGTSCEILVNETSPGQMHATSRDGSVNEEFPTPTLGEFMKRNRGRSIEVRYSDGSVYSTNSTREGF